MQRTITNRLGSINHQLQLISAAVKSAPNASAKWQYSKWYSMVIWCAKANIQDALPSVLITLQDQLAGYY